MSDDVFYRNIAQSILSFDDGIVEPLFGKFAHRIDAHRGNFLVGTRHAVISAYPVVARLVGEEYMQGLAQAFVQKFPPKTATLTLYGDEFPAFLRQFAPVQKDLPWLSAVAELDRAWFDVYSAADDKVMSGGQLAQGLRADLALLAPGLVAATKVLRFKIPAYSIWETNKDDQDVKAVDITKGGEWALLWRRDNQIFHTALSRAEYVFLNNVEAGLSFAQSFSECVIYDRNFDLQQQFSRWLLAGVFKEIRL